MSARNSYYGSYVITRSGINSQGNHYCNRDYSTESHTPANPKSYHYSNQNGSYYYSNPDGSRYYNNGSGSSVYTTPNGFNVVRNQESPAPNGNNDSSKS